MATTSTAASFNSRSREGSDNAIFEAHQERIGFNSRSREGSDAGGQGVPGSGLPVSIRAPARGATGVFHCHARTYSVSIRAPARGATSLKNLELCW